MINDYNIRQETEKVIAKLMDQYNLDRQAAVELLIAAQGAASVNNSCLKVAIAELVKLKQANPGHSFTTLGAAVTAELIRRKDERKGKQ